MTTWKRPADPYEDLTDEEVDAYVDDLFAHVRKPATVTISMRIPKDLLARVKAAADAAEVPYQTFIKSVLESTMSRIEPRLRQSSGSSKKRQAAGTRSGARLLSEASISPTNLTTQAFTSAAVMNPRAWRGDGFVSDRPIDHHVMTILGHLQEVLGRPLWLLIQSGAGRHGRLDDHVYDFFVRQASVLRAAGPIGLLIESPGGFEDPAFRLAKLLTRYCGRWTAIVGGRAKSAGTLLALGADELVMGVTAELGPLDPQVLEPDQSKWRSALQYLFVPYASNCYCNARKIEGLPPLSRCRHANASELVRAVQAKAAELLSPRYSKPQARSIAESLVMGFPNHEYAIRSSEATAIGLHTSVPAPELQKLTDQLLSELSGRTLIGSVSALQQSTAIGVTGEVN